MQHIADKRWWEVSTIYSGVGVGLVSVVVSVEGVVVYSAVLSRTVTTSSKEAIGHLKYLVTFVMTCLQLCVTCEGRDVE